jgi:hypothetical protein
MRIAKEREKAEREKDCVRKDMQRLKPKSFLLILIKIEMPQIPNIKTPDARQVPHDTGVKMRIAVHFETAVPGSCKSSTVRTREKSPHALFAVNHHNKQRSPGYRGNKTKKGRER